MAVEVERLVVSLEARLNQYERSFDRARRSTDTSMSAVEARVGRSRARVEQQMRGIGDSARTALGRLDSGLGSLGASFAGGFIGGALSQGLASIVPSIREATRSLSDLKAEAAKAGVDVEQFQALGYAARQSNVGVDALTDGLKELQLRADEFIVTGQGPAAEAFARLGYGADDLKTKLKNPSDLFLEIIGRLQAFDKAAQIRISDEVFGGTGGEQFVRFLDQGVAGIRLNMEEARKLGVVIDKDLVEKGAELDRKFQTIAETINNRVKSAIVNVAGALADWTMNAEKFLNTLGNSSFFAKMADLFGNPLEAEYYGVKRTAPPAGPAPASSQGIEVLRRALEATKGTARMAVPDRTQQLPATFVDPKLAGLATDFRDNLGKFITAAREAGYDLKVQSGFRSNERQAQLFADAVRKYGSESAARKWVAPPGASYHNKGSAADLAYGSDAARLYAHANAARFGLTFPLGNEPWHVEPAGQRGKPAIGDPDTSSIQEAARGKAATAADRQAEAVKRVMEALRLESAQIGETAAQQRALQEIQAAGVAANSAEGQAIAALVEQIYARKAAQEQAAQSAEQLAEAQRELGDMGADAVKGFVSDLRAGKSAADALRNALDRVLSRLTDNLIDSLFSSLLGGGGAGGGGGLLGSLLGSFGGARAAGGPVAAGKTYLVGEKGPEMFSPSSSGRIIPNKSLAPPIVRPRIPEARPGSGRLPAPAVSMTVKVVGPMGDKDLMAAMRQTAAQAGQQAYRMAVRDSARSSGKIRYNQEVLGQDY
ncbi:M15 family metallopeptidase [Hansschlegelia beijingensis]|uniref:D-alanyl-D-alanine carboxypeptidase-like core domain-containing protein n=1 Tax=Hansschlegelia beijingensis TaxID=1133344 RepID=A0A7W6GF35_9HYPH|nr:D-alanyl-D-alanine carboxypeptidase family protein [Hansschlegelia beijingensis]MBB3972512.1 hypothetical protein [Hansschlegelia beijingensis]